MNPAAIENVRRTIHSLLDACPELGDDEQLRADMLDGETDIDRIMSRLVRQLREEEAAEAGIASLLSLYQTRKKARATAATRIRATLAMLLDAAALPRWKGAEGTISLTHRGPKVLYVDGFDPASLPAAFRQDVTVTRPIDAAIKDALANGETVPGCALSNGSTSVMVR